MDKYIFDRIIIDATRVVALAEQQSKINHPGVKGRFRELLVDGILEPWLPLTVQCATGTVVSFTNSFRSKTQEDILLIDQSISPSVLIKPHVQEGVYMRNSVLARIEVKSILDSGGFDGFKTSCAEYHQLNLDLDRGFWKLNRDFNWDEYECQTTCEEAERLAAFVGLISNTAFSQHISAQGRDRLSSLESGVGQYFNNWKSIS